MIETHFKEMKVMEDGHNKNLVVAFSNGCYQAVLIKSSDKAAQVARAFRMLAQSIENDPELKEVIGVGDIVQPVSYEYQLASGASRYEDAVVVSVTPFVLVSRQGDMRWGSTVEPGNFKVTGAAGDKLMAICNRRLAS